MDWEKIGLRMGLEIHQQLDTESKLFCPCRTELTDSEPDHDIVRNLRPTQSELGKFDRAAFEEAMRRLHFHYENYFEETCLVEADEEPPHPLNPEALEIAVTIALLLNMRVVDEFHTMRKQVIDGSNTGGFQRTGLVATDGHLETPQGTVKIENLCLEEDAARRIRETGDGVVFRLDRLGIPLVEITTDPSISDPQQLREVAYQIGQILRSTRVKRGLGTIRQDLNISIRDGARVEVKGVQDLDLIPEIVEREVRRQLSLVEIRNTLQERGAMVEDEIFDVSDVFTDTESRIISSAESVLAVKLRGFDGLIGVEIQPGRRLGTEMADYAKKRGVSGIFHTDELPAYGITEDEVQGLREAAGASPGDAVVMVAHDRDTAEKALREVIRRAEMAIQGVPEETRKALPDGNTQYLRPLPTSSRMYLETDIPLFRIEEDLIEDIRRNLPELPSEKKERIMREYGLSEDLASQLVKRNLVDEFEALVEFRVDVTVIASLLAYTLRELRREGHDVDGLGLDELRDAIKLLEDGKISRDALRDIVACMADEGLAAEDAAAKLNLLLLSEDEIQAIIQDIVEGNLDMISERGMGAMGPLMGKAMGRLRGRADGKVVNRILREKIQERL
ncbi:Glu-tRNA(Gln) amidotransferase GatDE subunit E [Methanothermobacter thermautotrophicus]|uniref:Glutamyl-tRNA(Gln) amidotransferase subunit E n=1 Tax=Methanothermobacter thermautotrophicus TaxID=145262 RepID=A0A842YJY6_METTF|nr:Glu-tRNA(Gln) amidotransferase subunit GatE [Methanothermobacter thermautotrophicus]MBE2899666.1 Glu-tRNA(Gln) amidotransferase GatDE subunit E [Methanothermobacter thermautotrophicus]